MRTSLVLSYGFTAVLAVPSSPQPRVPSLPASWKPGVKWQIVIHAPVDVNQTEIIPTDAGVWDIDYFHALSYPDIIPTLKSPKPGDDNVVLCYINVGAIEQFEADYADFPGDALGNGYDGYPEWWVDIRRPDVVEFMKKRLHKAAEIGCDGVDADNIDGYDWEEEGVDKTGWHLAREDLITYAKTLASTAHSLTTTRGLPLMFGQKNANHIARDLVSTVDFAVLEDCQGFNWRSPGVHEAFCYDFQAFVTGENRTDGKRLPVFELEYPGSTGNGSEELSGADWWYYCEREERLVGNEGFSQVIKHESDQLDGWGQYCGENERLGRVRTATLPIGNDAPRKGPSRRRGLGS